MAPWLLALAEVPQPQGRPDVEEEFAKAWTDLLATLSLHTTLGEIIPISDRAREILESIMDLLDVGDKVSFDWCDVLAYDLQSAKIL